MDTLSGEATLLNWFCPPLEKESTPKGKNYFLLENRPLFRKGLMCWESNRKSPKVVSLVGNGGKTRCIKSP